MSQRFAVLREFGEHYYAMTNAVQRMSTPELRKLRDSIKRVTQTNCSWAVYAAAQFLRSEVRGELWRRARSARTLAHKARREIGGS